jgi:hypothetical protein
MVVFIDHGIFYEPPTLPRATRNPPWFWRLPGCSVALMTRGSPHLYFTIKHFLRSKLNAIAGIDGIDLSQTATRLYALGPAPEASYENRHEQKQIRHRRGSIQSGIF